MTLSTKVLIGLGLGVLAGLGFGDDVAFMGAIGRGFILLLQMTVLPFVSISLITGLGGLTPARARGLVRFAGGFLLVIWCLTLTSILLAPLAFPDWRAASFFSTSLVEKREPFDFVGAYIPSNPFRSLSDGVVPAVVVFSVAFGLALMGSERKAALLESFLAAQDALRAVTRGVIRLAPIGVFAIAADASGSMNLEQFGGLQVYAATYIGIALLLGFWVLPVLVTAVTPLGYREMLGPVRDALITAFATGSVFVVLPILAERCKELLAIREAGEDASRLVDVVVPISFTLAGAGKLLSLLFVLFAGWLSGFPVAPSEYPEFVVTGIFSSFATSTVAIPFLLDLFRIPADTFQLYLIADKVVGDRFGSMLAAVHTLSLALLAACGVAGWVTFHKRRIFFWAMGTIVLMLAILGAIRLSFETVDRPYVGYRKFIQRSFVLPTVPWSDRDEPPDPILGPAGETMVRVRTRGRLRVGYLRDSLPYVFRNEAGELVGLDVEMAHSLARDLGVRVEFFRIRQDRMRNLLESGAVDIVMSGLAITPEKLLELGFSRPYLEETLAFVVSDHRRKEFRSRDAVKKLSGLRLAVPSGGDYAAKTREYLVDAELVVVDSPRDFFKAADGEFDGLLYAAEPGSAWTLIYPSFAVAVPHPDLMRVPLGVAFARDDLRLRDFLDAWILLKQRDGTIDRLFAYWFEGKDPSGRGRRWSLARDVLGWKGRATADADAQPHD